MSEKMTATVCRMPGLTEDCSCFACSEQLYQESYDSIIRERDNALARVAELESKHPEIASAIAKGESENAALRDALEEIYAAAMEVAKSGTDLGFTILQWAVYNRPELTGGQVRSAIQTIIGPEADARLQDYLNRPL